MPEPGYRKRNPFWESVANWLGQLFLLGSWLLLALKTGVGSSRKFILELLDSARRIDKFQFSSVKGVAYVTNVHAELFANAFGNETVPTPACDLSFDVVWVNLVFHNLYTTFAWVKRQNEFCCNGSGVGEEGLEPPTPTV